MSAYVIVDINVHDTEAYEGYKNLTPATLALYGGRFVVRGGQAETLEGNWMPARVVVLEFSDMEQAKKWWSSPEYAPAKRIRQAYATTDMIVVEGL